MKALRSLARATALAAALAGATLVTGHVAIVVLTHAAPPPLDVDAVPLDPSATAVRAGVREVFLHGAPEAMGLEHARILRDRMTANEAALWREYERRVPWWVTRMVLLDWGRLRFRGLDLRIPEPRRRELAGEALGFVPDPFADRMDTYQRLLFLHALYDVSIPLERSPLIGCTSVGLGLADTADGHALVGRTFDFEAGDWLDRDKVVFFVREEGHIPFASVGWPGFVGVVTGMNAEGLFVAAHGGRAGSTTADGLPVAFSLREVLSRARDTPEAVALLSAQRVLVSHIVFLADGRGRFAVVERAPGVPAHVRRGESHLAVTNHFEGPLANDPANRRVERTTTTLARRTRADALLAALPPGAATPEAVLRLIRDRRCDGGALCPPGDRRAIDAGIAAHGIVADTTARTLWVSVGPHLSGPFVRFDLGDLLAADRDPAPDREPAMLPADPAVLP